MKTIVYAHPWDGSYNHAILTSITEKLETKREPFQVIDLYKDGFNPVFTAEELKHFHKGETPYSLVKDYQEKLKQSTELIFIFPVWWWDLPAILKGFIDKVMLSGFAFIEDQNTGTLKGLLTNIKKTTVTEKLETKREPFQVIDLYKDGFNPVFTAEELKHFHKGETPYSLVKDYQEKLKQSTELIFIFPVWWWDLPAILKGFIDKVMLSGFAFIEDQNTGTLKGLLTNIKKTTVTEKLETKREPFQVIDLYKDGFNPVFTAEELKHFHKGETPYSLVKDYQEKLKQSTELIFIFPVWWWDLPAILKGFIDKVMLSGFAFIEDQNTGTLKGLLTNIKKTTVISTSTTDKEYIESEAGNAIQSVFINRTLADLGLKNESTKWIHFSRVNLTTDEKRKQFLKEISQNI
ncbi:hypothetical protein HER23_15400 [Bacillus altitudinis S70-5-12]|uniref:NAD(P)H-dependent oxidoreductase n=1 Tax=Bacillus altitudinis TaxID=293387 RepID=UPI001D9703E2|nr:NAD(P)H-dependent oxidoreductase [Bacillus altitudinis]MBR0629404.1 hypothetical protein [Bacillus altitudinis S70-5-12]